jgi:hypothetical protein
MIPRLKKYRVSVDYLARLAGLMRPDFRRDPVHFKAGGRERSARARLVFFSASATKRTTAGVKARRRPFIMHHWPHWPVYAALSVALRPPCCFRVNYTLRDAAIIELFRD